MEHSFVYGHYYRTTVRLWGSRKCERVKVGSPHRWDGFQILEREQMQIRSARNTRYSTWRRSSTRQNSLFKTPTGGQT